MRRILGRWLCWMDLHLCTQAIAHPAHGRMTYCRRPDCHHVFLRDAEPHVELDICATQWVYGWTTIHD